MHEYYFIEIATGFIKQLHKNGYNFEFIGEVLADVYVANEDAQIQLAKESKEQEQEQKQEQDGEE